MNPELIKAQINQAIITQNNEQLRQYAHTLKTAILETDELLEQYFEILLDLLTNDNLLNLESAWDFFFVLKSCRDFFNMVLVINELTLVTMLLGNLPL